MPGILPRASRMTLKSVREVAVPWAETVERSRISTVLTLTVPRTGWAWVSLAQMVKARQESSNQGRYFSMLALFWLS